MNVLVTGCAGFIGSHTCEALIKDGHRVAGIDAMTYAAKESNLSILKSHNNFSFEKINILEFEKILDLVKRESLTHIVNFAAETHVDNSIQDVAPFIQSNILGVSSLINVTREKNLSFIQISTDEVYGVPNNGKIFDENSPLNPRNPYSATKAAGDHLILSAINTHKINARIIRPSNNFGQRQHYEKFIPTILRSIKNKKKIPVYGDGKNLREWTFVKDTANCISKNIENVFKKDNIIFNLSSEHQLTNIQVISEICEILNLSENEVVEFIKDRPGHDREYRIKNTLLEERTPFRIGLDQTIKWEIN